MDLLKEEISHYQFDSRKVQKNDLFFALKGEKADGHHFLQQVAANEAYGAVVSKNYRGESFGLRLFYVDDVLFQLQKMAKEKREKMSATIIGITGSCGKTTTKEFLAHLLKKRYNVYSSYASYNSQITLPISLLNAPEHVDLLILEISMSEKKEIDKLISIASPDICIITKVALCHAVNFPEGLSGIAEEKLKIFSSKNFKKGYYPYDLLQYFGYLKNLPDFTSISVHHKEADFFLSVQDLQMAITENKKTVFFSLPFTEQHLLEDFLIAGSVCRYFHMSWNEIYYQIGSMKSIAMRFEKFYQNGILFINDAYNANPESVKMALMHMPKPMHEGKRIIVLGDMKELGKFSKQAHEDVFHQAKQQSDVLLCMGEEFYALLKKRKNRSLTCHFSDHQSLAQYLKTIMKKDDVVLVKGSRSMMMEKIFTYL